MFRKDGIRNIENITEWKLTKTRPRVRTRKRWMASVQEGLKTMGVKNLLERDENRGERRRIVEEAKTDGLYLKEEISWIITPGYLDCFI